MGPTIAQRLEAIAIFAASFALAVFVVANKPYVDHMLHVLGPFAIPVAIVIFAVVASAPFSVTDALAVSNGVLFGPWLGTAVNTAGLVLAAILGYLVALRTSKLLNIEEQVAKLPKWIGRFKVGSPIFLIVVRAIPGMGGTIATQTAAALRVPMWRQIYTMCTVTVPVCAVLAFGGNAVSDYVQNHIVAPAQHYATRHHIHFPHRKHEALPSPLPLTIP
jgi:uncharacterized membrane protein YdjX (TVP38/TMEM64 family)